MISVSGSTLFRLSCSANQGNRPLCPRLIAALCYNETMEGECPYQKSCGEIMKHVGNWLKGQWVIPGW